MAGATALDSLPQLHGRYGNYDISQAGSSWVGGETSLAFQADVTKERQNRSCFSTPPACLQVYPEPSARGRLQTPPAENMNSAAYQPQQHGRYATRQGIIYPSSYQTSATGQQLYSTDQSRAPPASAASSFGMSGQSYPKTHSPPNTNPPVLAPIEETARRKNSILPSLQIPASINSSGGSIGEFAAQITCLFWFESVATLRKAEEWTIASSPVKPLVRDAIPTTPFRKWVVTILSTTQVTPNVILLALLFIYRLKTLNPTVKGKAGSEYRLLTVALMLGNKFLDDNTYTNKTWAEVSGISVTEIHVMEVEFLSNMRYSLLASKEQWKEWQGKLEKFWDYFERAQKAPPALPSPVAVTQQVILSSPASIQASPTIPSYPQNSTSSYNHNQQWSSNHTPLVSPLPSMPDLIPELKLQAVRKRSCDDGVDEPPAKRSQRGAPQAPQSAVPTTRQNIPRLPVPSLSVSTTQMSGYPAVSNLQPNLQTLQNLPLLPPLGGRAMSTVYPTTPSWTPHTQATLTPTNSGHSTSFNLGGAAYGTPTRRHSPRSVHDIISMNSSPISGNFPVSGHGLNSPSFFLQQRSSPYRPVRPPNTLLYPSSGSIHSFNANIDQMHYQPLGKRNDYRSGVVPEYAANHVYSQWPVLPQPNF